MTATFIDIEIEKFCGRPTFNQRDTQLHSQLPVKQYGTVISKDMEHSSATLAGRSSK